MDTKSKKILIFSVLGLFICIIIFFVVGILIYLNKEEIIPDNNEERNRFEVTYQVGCCMGCEETGYKYSFKSGESTYTFIQAGKENEAVKSYQFDEDTITNFGEWFAMGLPNLEDYFQAVTMECGPSLDYSVYIEFSDTEYYNISYRYFDSVPEGDKKFISRLEEIMDKELESKGLLKVADATPLPTTKFSKPSEVKVYLFSEDKFNEVGNSDYTSAVTRQTNRKDVAAYVIEQIILGPDESEMKQNLKSTFGINSFVWFTGESNCNGKDFKITILDKVADVQFCKQTMLAGDMSGFIVKDQIVKSLKQFSTIEKVRILDVNGNCFDDMSGLAAGECYY